MSAQTSCNTLPSHIAIIMDGNGRWAKARGLSRLEGHRSGVKAALDIVRYAGELGIPYLTLYAFSSENWNRPHEEVTGLMHLLHFYLRQECKELIANGVSLRTIGDISKLPHSVRDALADVCEKTKNGTRIRVTVALSYGSRDEIVRATRKIAQLALLGKLNPEQIDEALFQNYLDTQCLPDPDLFIRTGGEKRLSNFLLYQVSYAELYLSETAWPDFSRADLDSALAEFARRQRRFGRTSEQVVG
jgi:undecaprenyl diphosphate synthase